MIGDLDEFLPHSYFFVLVIFFTACHPNVPLLNAIITPAASQPIVSTQLPISPTIQESPIPNPTVKLLFTKTPELPPEFVISTANKIPPSDILIELEFFPQGGGGACPGKYSSLTGGVTEEAELMEAAVFVVCGWKQDEHVKATIQRPDGKIETKDFIASGSEFEAPSISLWYIPTIFDPVGQYSFTLSGESGTIQGSTLFKMPTGSRLYVMPEKFGGPPKLDSMKEHQLLLYRFSPNEIVKLYAYRYSEYGFGFLAWQEFIVDTSGDLIIKSDLNASYYAAKGEKSGEVHLFFYNFWKDVGTLYDPFKDMSVFSTNIYVGSNRNECPGAPPQRVEVGDTARVCTKSDKLIVRINPKRKAQEVTRIPPGTYFNIIDGPECANNWTWWKIETDDGIEGWVSEGGDNIDPYFICPER